MARRFEPLKRRSSKGSSTWADVQGPHPGVRDPRAVRVDDWPLGVNAGIISTFVLLTAFALLAAWYASPVGEADTWARWKADRHALSVEYPEGWTVRPLSQEDTNVHVVVMRSPWVRVHLVSQRELSSVAQVYARAGNVRSPYQALETLHESTRETWSSFFGALDEGRTTRTVIGTHPAVWSQFTYSGGRLESGEPMRGYRATILAGGSGVIASAVAPADNWSEFKPIALRVLRSIRIERDAA